MMRYMLQSALVSHFIGGKRVLWDTDKACALICIKIEQESYNQICVV